ncbi:MAG: arsenate reductase (glutaredoxin) [Calditrichaeota bacterium]|nr:arsenate reductase (glutaredoxin) [Calditrichota bacterium]
MEKVIIWHNPRCRKSREGLNYLKEKGIEPVIFDYLKEGIPADELADLIKKSGLPVEAFIRSNEKEYRELGLKGKSLTAEEFARIAANHPRLLQRPIVVYGDRVVLARPASEIDKLFT